MNIIIALEKSGELLTRTSSIFYNLAGSNSNPQRRELQTQLAPMLAAHRDNMFLNHGQFEKTAIRYQQTDTLNLT